MTRIPGCVWTPVEYDPQFPLGKAFPRPLSAIRYTVNHDAQGYRSFLKRGQAPGRQASWLISNLLDGTRLQHYELEAGTWTSGGYAQNTAGVATEHESQIGDMSLPITQSQADADIETERFLKTVCPNLLPPVLGQGRREHRDFPGQTTSCPSGRIITLYNTQEDDDMTDAEYRALMAKIKDIPTLAQIRQAVAEEQHKMVENTATKRNKALHALVRKEVDESHIGHH